MRAPVPLALVVSSLAPACAPVPAAPTELSDLSRYLYREFDAEDPRVLEAGVRNLVEFLQGVDLDADRADRSFAVGDLLDEDVADLTRPDRAVDLCLPVAIAGASRHPVAANARWLVEPDQTPAEASATYYDRTFPDEPDPACFIDRACDRIRTRNDAERQNLLLTVAFVLWKDFRWVRVTDAEGEEQGHAIVARSWFEESFYGENGQNALLQSHATDVWIDRGATTARYQALWSETELAIEVEEEVVRTTILSGIDASFGRMDDAIDGLDGG